MGTIHAITFHDMLETQFYGTEQRLLISTSQLLCERGYHRTTLEHIANNMGCREPTIYHYVESKAALLKMLSGLLVTYCRQVVFSPLQQQKVSGKENLLAFADILMRFFKCRDIRWFCLLPLEADGFGEKQNEYYFLWQMLLVGLLYNKGEAPPDLSLIHHSVSLIHMPIISATLWDKPFAFSLLLKNLYYLWRDIIGHDARLFVDGTLLNIDKAST